MTHRKPEFLNDPETLPKAEKDLIAACVRGKPCILGSKRPEPDDTTAPTIRAQLIRFLALGGDDDHPVDPFGVALRGARVEGKLSLAFCQNLRPLILSRCEVREPVTLVDAGLPRLDLSGSCLSGKGEDGDSLFADGVQVSGPVFLRDGFEAHGTVRLSGAELGGELSCIGGTFRASDVALNADGLKAQGGVFLRAGFEAHGTVRLLGAELGGNLSCDGGTFRASDVALHADGLKTRGGMFLRAGFEAHGTVRLLGAELGGDLACIGGTFRAAGEALLLKRAQVDGGFFFQSQLERPKGTVDLTAAEVGTLVDDAESWPAPGKLVLDGFTYKRFAGDAPTNAAMRMTWLERQSESDLTVDFRPQPFEQVAKVLREMGHAEDARRILIRKAQKERRADLLQARARLGPWFESVRGLSTSAWAWAGMYLRWVRSGLFGIVSGYGYRPMNSLLWAALFMAFGFLTFDAAKTAREMVPNNPFLLKQEWKVARKDKRDPYAAFAEAVPDFQPFSPVIYAVDTFVPLVNLHQEPHWIPRGGTWARLYLNIHIAMGWLITTLFVASLTGIVKKD
ncbi:MAG: hypothetical protein AAGC79_10720 [Pseudomonadota bacterium]